MNRKKTYITLLICTLGSVGLVTLLFALSDTGLERDNSIVRRFLAEPPRKAHELDIEYNSYYIAGAAEGQIYLGNVTAPLNLLILDTTLRKKRHVRLSLGGDSLPFRSLKLQVVPPHFFLMDGTLPYVSRGDTIDWKARSILNRPFYFARVQPIDSASLFIRARSNRTNEHVLGKICLADTAKITLSHELLQKQVDGSFGTDGMLLYNDQLERLVYTYYYRNQYIVADMDLRLDYFGRTIDTISQAQIKVGTIASKNQRTLAAPALVVNKNAATYENYLFINSQLLGRNESIETWDEASIIDVYDLTENSYQLSFYVQDVRKKKLRSFQVHGDKLIGLIGSHIVTYHLNERDFKGLRQASKRIIDPKITAISDSP